MQDTNFLRKLNHTNFLRKMHHTNFLRKLNHTNFLRKLNHTNFLRYKFSAKKSSRRLHVTQFHVSHRFSMITCCFSTWQFYGITSWVSAESSSSSHRLSMRLEQDPSNNVADCVLYCLQQVASHLSRIFNNTGSVPGNVFASYFNFGSLYPLFCFLPDRLVDLAFQYSILEPDPPFGVGGGGSKDTTYLRTLPTTFYWLLNLSWHGNIQLARVGITRQARKVKFESQCDFWLLDRGVAMQ